MDPVRIGLVGHGFGGRYSHAPLIAASPECEFIGVVTSSDVITLAHTISARRTQHRRPIRQPCEQAVSVLTQNRQQAERRRHRSVDDHRSSAEWP